MWLYELIITSSNIWAFKRCVSTHKVTGKDRGTLERRCDSCEGGREFLWSWGVRGVGLGLNAFFELLIVFKLKWALQMHSKHAVVRGSFVIKTSCFHGLRKTESQ